MCKDVRKMMLDRTDGVFVNMQRCYRSIIDAANVGEVSLSRKELTTRRQVDDIISAADVTFQDVLDSDLADVSVPVDDAAEDKSMEMDQDDEDELDNGEQGVEDDEDDDPSSDVAERDEFCRRGWRV